MVHEVIQFASMTVQIRDIPRIGTYCRHFLGYKKIGGKRMSLAATGIDFNRILLSA